MASDFITPYLLTTGVAAANAWYNSGNPAKAIKPLVMGGIATSLAALFSNAQGMGPVMKNIGWIAFIAVMISPVQKPSPTDNLLKITGTK